MTPLQTASVPIVRMEGAEPDLAQLLAEVIDDAPGSRIRAGLAQSSARDQGGDRLHHQPKVLLTLAQCFFRPSLIVDVGEHVIPADNLASVVEQGFSPDVHPAVDPIEAPYAMDQVQRLSQCVTP